MSAVTALEGGDASRAAAKTRNGAAPDAPRKRGRPPAESPRDRLARLEREIADVRAAVREAEQRKFTILGEAVAAEAEINPELRATLKEILARRVTSPAAKAEIAPLLAAA